MSGDVLRLLLRNKTGRTQKPAHGARPVERTSRKEMIERRDHCIAEIARLRSDTNASGNLADKALQLLTRHWSVSSWRARGDILRTAEWLLGISRKAAGASMPAPNATVQNDNVRDGARDVPSKREVSFR
jgi:hypothetical protein